MSRFHISKRLILIASVLLLLAIIPFSPLYLTFGALLRTLSKVLLNVPADARPVILVLLGLWTWTVAELWVETRRLRQEEDALSICRTRLKNCQQSLDGSTLQQWLLKVPGDTLLPRAAQAVWDCRDLHSPDLGAVSDALAGLEETRANLGRNVANRLLLISLLGTVLGLAGVISTLQPQLTDTQVSHSYAQLKTSLMLTLAPISTAFASTAWGILLATTISWLAARVNDRRADHVAQVQHFAVAELAPRLLPVSQAATLDRMRQLFEQSEEYLRSNRQLLQDVRAENDAYHHSLNTESQQAIEAIKQLVVGVEATMRAVTAELYRALTEAGTFVADGAKAQIDVANQLDALLGQATTELENTAREIGQHIQSLTTAASHVQASYTALDSTLGKVEKALEGQRGSIRDVLKEHREQADQMVQSQREDAEKILESQRATVKALSDDIAVRLTGVVGQVAETLRRAEPKLPSPDEWVHLSKTLQQCTDAAQAFSVAVIRLANLNGASGANGLESADGPPPPIRWPFGRR